MHTHVLVSLGHPPMPNITTQRWSYLNHIEDVDVGDWVIVPFGSENKFRLALVEATKFPIAKKSLATKFIVDKVDIDKWNMVTALHIKE